MRTTRVPGISYLPKFQSDNKNHTDYPSAKSGITPESVIDRWHTFVFDFASDGSAEVRVDGAITFETSAGFYNYSTDDAFSVVLGGRSYGATVNLYDSISVHQVPEPAAFVLLLLGGLTLLTIGRSCNRDHKTILHAWTGNQKGRQCLVAN